MLERLRASDHCGALEVLASAEGVNARMVNMALTSLMQTGASVDAAATETLRMCARCDIKPTREIFNNSKFISVPPNPEAHLMMMVDDD